MRYARMAVVFALGMVAHWWWTTHFTLGGLAPQLLLVATVAAASRRGPVAAMCFGFAWGLFLDTFRTHLFGANAMLLTIIGYAVGSMRRQLDVGALAPQCVLVLGMSWAYYLCLGLLGLLMLKDFIWVGWKPFLLDPFYNCLTIPLVLLVWDRMIES